MRFQIQEMARAERMLRDEQIAHEIETYNELIPDDGELVGDAVHRDHRRRAAAGVAAAARRHPARGRDRGRRRRRVSRSVPRGRGAAHPRGRDHDDRALPEVPVHAGRSRPRSPTARRALVVDHPDYHGRDRAHATSQRAELAHATSTAREPAVHVRDHPARSRPAAAASAAPRRRGLRPPRARGRTLAPGAAAALVPTGLAVAIPSGYAGFVLPRSGLAMKHGDHVPEHTGPHRPAVPRRAEGAARQHGPERGVHVRARRPHRAARRSSGSSTSSGSRSTSSTRPRRDTFGFGIAPGR